MFIENLDACALLASKDRNFVGLKVNDDWMVTCNDGISISVPFDLNQWLIGGIFFVPVVCPGNVINCLSVVLPMTDWVFAKITFSGWQNFSVVLMDNFECAKAAAELCFGSSGSVSKAFQEMSKRVLDFQEKEEVDRKEVKEREEKRQERKEEGEKEREFDSCFL